MTIDGDEASVVISDPCAAEFSINVSGSVSPDVTMPGCANNCGRAALPDSRFGAECVFDGLYKAANEFWYQPRDENQSTCEASYKAADMFIRNRVKPLIDSAAEREQIRWQEAIDEIVLKFDPDRDGSGSDSCDPLDVTLGEIMGAFNKMNDAIHAANARAEKAEQRIERLEGLLREAKTYMLGDQSMVGIWERKVDIRNRIDAELNKGTTDED